MEHAPAVADGVDFAAFFFDPGDGDFAPVETLVVEGGEEFGVEGETVFVEEVDDLAVVGGFDDFGTALGIGAAEFEEEAGEEEEGVVEERAAETFLDVGLGGALADAEDGLIRLGGEADEVEHVVGADAAIGIDECEPCGIGGECPGFVND